MSDARKLTIKYEGREQKLKLYEGHATSSIETAIRARWQLPSESPISLQNAEGKQVALDNLKSGVYTLFVDQSVESAAASKIQSAFREYREKKEGGARKSALLIIDVQYDFLPPTGSLAVTDGNAVIPVINNLRKDHKWDVVALTQDWHPKGHFSFASTNKEKGAKLFTPFEYEPGKFQMMWPDHCVQGSEGAKFHHDLKRNPTDIVVQKGTHLDVDSYSGFCDNDHKSKTDLAEQLKKHKITDVYCAGLAYDYCVGFSALDALQEGFKVYFIEDGARGVASETTADMRKKLLAAGVHLINASQVRLP
jgi:nicotinamidase/pyrazinamidase